ncbi:MAG: hypothetical protein CMH54_15630 [Myxococcales bacterium]|nr:hypothetical protein [Myxococcales bacterium]
MAQVTQFPTFPNIPSAQVLELVGVVARAFATSNPTFRELRDQLRTRNVWEKERTPSTLQFLGVSLADKKALTGGKLMARFHELDDRESQNELLFSFFLDRNPLLIKTVFTALDVDMDGRIQSTNELYRIVTSYVYPGEHITLPAFRDWIAWMESISVIRMVGIRWGYGDVGLAKLEEIRQMDIDEILEDEADGIPSQWDSMEVAEPSAPAPVETMPEPVGTVAEEEYVEEMPDLPPEAPIPSEAAIRAAEEQFEEETGEVVALPPQGVAAVATSKNHLRSVADLGTPIRHGTVTPGTPPPARVLPTEIAPVFVAGGTVLLQPLTEEQKTANADRVCDWWKGYVFRHPHRAADFGISFDEDPDTLLFKLAVASIYASRSEGGTAAQAVHRALSESGFLDRVRTGGASVEEAIADAGVLALVGGDPRFLDVLPRLVHVSLALRTEQLSFNDIKALDPKLVIEHLHVRMFGRLNPLAPFWLIREAVLGGVLDAETFGAMACVPTWATRSNAYRLGFTETLYGESLDDLIQLSEDMAHYFGPDSDFTAGLDHLQDQLGCRFRCPFASGCSYDCREKTAG